MQRTDPDLVNLIIEHVDQKVEALLADILDLLGKVADGFDAC